MLFVIALKRNEIRKSSIKKYGSMRCRVTIIRLRAFTHTCDEEVGITFTTAVLACCARLCEYAARRFGHDALIAGQMHQCSGFSRPWRPGQNEEI